MTTNRSLPVFPKTRILDFHSPYGCSKGSADQYVIDYHRIYGLRTIVFRQSCIYGYRQFGAEDQGWVAWFMIASQLGRPITIYGDGKQVRDILFIDDLLDAYDAAFAAGADKPSGKRLQHRRRPENVVSLLELLAYIEKRQAASSRFGSPTGGPGDQKVFVSDIRRAPGGARLEPANVACAGLGLLYDWIAQNRELVSIAPAVWYEA